MLYCPKCAAKISSDSEFCKCGAAFSGAGYQPVSEILEKNKSNSIGGFLVKLGFASVIIPFAGFLIGIFFSASKS